MADKYLKSGASGAADGSSWTNAYTTLAAAAAGMSAGDRLFVSHQHSESQASAMTITFPGTPSSPNIVVCANDGAEPPTTVADTATVTTTGGSALTINGSVYVYGIAFSAGSGANNSALSLALANSTAAVQLYEKCKFTQGSTAVSIQRIAMGTNNTNAVMRKVVWKNCDAKFSAAANAICPQNTAFEWLGGSVLSGTTTPNHVFSCNLGNATVGWGEVRVSGVDFSNLGTSAKFFNANSYGVGVMRNCKLPASWNGSLIDTSVASPAALQVRFEMFNCDDGDTNYRLWVEEAYSGSIKHEATIVRSGGASDGTTPLAWKMASSANTEYPSIPLTSGEMVIWNDTTGASKTVTVEIVHDSQGAGTGGRLLDDEIWLEVQYLGTSGVPLGSFITDAKADVLASAADQADSAESWTTTGLTSPLTQKLAVTFTPQEKGFIHARVKLAKASSTVYVDPKLTVS